MILPFPNDFKDFSQVSLFIAVICIIEILVTIFITNVLPSTMGNILELEAQDIQTGILIRGEEYSAARDFLNQGRYTVRFNIFASEHPWTLRLSFKRTGWW